MFADGLLGIPSRSEFFVQNVLPVKASFLRYFSCGTTYVSFCSFLLAVLYFALTTMSRALIKGKPFYVSSWEPKCGQSYAQTSPQSIHREQALSPTELLQKGKVSDETFYQQHTASPKVSHADVETLSLSEASEKKKALLHRLRAANRGQISLSNVNQTVKDLQKASIAHSPPVTQISCSPSFPLPVKHSSIEHLIPSSFPPEDTSLSPKQAEALRKLARAANQQGFCMPVNGKVGGNVEEYCKEIKRKAQRKDPTTHPRSSSSSGKNETVKGIRYICGIPQPPKRCYEKSVNLRLLPASVCHPQRGDITAASSKLHFAEDRNAIAESAASQARYSLSSSNFLLLKNRERRIHGSIQKERAISHSASNRGSFKLSKRSQRESSLQADTTGFLEEQANSEDQDFIDDTLMGEGV
ncbi:hypothetical protein IE077_001010 [Cardiosporidium cionae]|uniref:Uncharacterized protein n=1 Tax=Cardiosporidium cionae TaxID=476202 RepID=A0ABQ7J653_9APIC|nr:hypothetical protein IE077_001010 [Cardiosporidium cionae]|eukprot:KAF8819458.1 hypothetical protein IE077_001010 [Cardiosporidium cionae]